MRPGRLTAIAGAATVFLLASAPVVIPGVELEPGPLNRVSEDLEDAPHVEPYLAADPRNPDVLVAGSIVFIDSEPVVHGFVSHDRGRSWQRFPLDACGVDPWVDFGSDGTVFVVCLGRLEGKGRIIVYRSGDGGLSWQAPVVIPAGGGGSTDRPVFAVDLPYGDGTAGDRRGTVTVAFGQHFRASGLAGQVWGPAISRSEDGGKSFSEPIFIRHDNLEQQPLDAAMLSDGTFIVAFMDFGGSGRLLSHRRTWLIRSLEDRDGFSIPILLREQVGSEMPWSLAVDRAPLHRDRIYVAVDGFWERQGVRPGALKGSSVPAIFVIYSDDRGVSWSPPVPVSDGPTESNGEIPAIAVNSKGVIAVAWYDTRNDPQGLCFDIYLSVSIDGGESFEANHRVTPRTSCPRSSKRQMGLARRYQFGGDYSGLAAGADDAFHLFWADSRTGLYQLWHQTVKVAIGG